MKQQFTRRQFLGCAAAGSAAGFSGCGHAPAPVPSEVSIVRSPAYGQDLYATMRSILEQHRLDVRGRNILLKPNLVEFEPGSSINTHPLVVHATMEAFHAMGAASVRIG